MTRHTAPDANPTQEYQRRLDDRRARLQEQESRDRQIALLRLLTAGLFFFLLWWFWGQGWALMWLGIPVLLFVVLVAVHDRVIRNRDRARRAVAFYEQGMARIEDRWAGTGVQTVLAPESHLYAADLDLFGKGSLFELLCTARTRAGEEALAASLLAPRSPEDVRNRQAAIEELRFRLDLREELALLGMEVRAAVHPEWMERWGARKPVLTGTLPRIAAPLIAAFVIAMLSGIIPLIGGPIAIAVVLAAEGLFGLTFRPRVRQVMAAVEHPGKELQLLSQLLRRLETEPFESRALRELQARIQTAGHPPSRQIARLSFLTDMLAWRSNQVFGVISLLMLWATQVAFAIEAWRRRCGPHVSVWLRSVGEFEALCALASYAYEHPDDPFPAIVDSGAVMEGEDLRHPLIPASQCVANSVRLGRELQLLVVSGSNMSGKSTLLRTVGINVVLAFAGAPVRAKSMSVSPLAIGATLRIQDSLQAGVSRFYAEIQRIRDIVALTGRDVPVLFLLDEILHGTNSHDRAIGAEAIIRGLLQRGAIGMVTTHDLALTRMAEALVGQATNVHFEDHMENGKMVFDYRMRPDVVRKSNALELMRSIGLEV